jgi:hypothetical protein
MTAPHIMALTITEIPIDFFFIFYLQVFFDRKNILNQLLLLNLKVKEIQLVLRDSLIFGSDVQQRFPIKQHLLQ